ncbi:MAG: hypothetical protein MI785_10075 [Kiloniellales bacterium]|nr:hypothetical protein [Kiloniellales bacterium]
MRFPIIYGTVNLIASSRVIPKGATIQNLPVCNVVQQLEGITDARVRSLSPKSLEYVFNKFKLGFSAFNVLEASSSLHEFIPSAEGDILAAVGHLMSNTKQYGLSKWASLQASEKVLKALIKHRGSTFPKNHDLSGLETRLKGTGAKIDVAHLLSLIQCQAGIRYGEVPCDRDAALAAHHASLALIVELHKADVGLSATISL